MANFHEGELMMQAQFGMAESMARVGEVAIRSFMPEQHQHFFSLLPSILIGSVDEYLQPTASILMGVPGFVRAVSAELLVVQAMPNSVDVLNENLQQNRPLGLLGLQAHTKRRNRMNGLVIKKTQTEFHVQVQQSFGNCPKYIVEREIHYCPRNMNAQLEEARELTPSQIDWIATADTFFMATAHPNALSPLDPNHGVDISHRAGPSGFIGVNKNTLSIPDYRGNYFFNSFGNLRLNPKAGLLFLNFKEGNLLQLEVSVEFRIATTEEKSQGIQIWLDCTIHRSLCTYHALQLKQI